ncbi:DUF302 domain-containing protein [Salinicola peritrichatus]|uniref:DUF302 domain-containing protein n=1 Tax=Salinicola peritrichatus TaxID=1267424 RepID=UPI001955148E|nr:DUF302 domain-containing protein [Salinicola peritrichatus]
MIRFAFRRTVMGTLAAVAMGIAGLAIAQEPATPVPGLIVQPSDASVHDTAVRFAEQARTSGMTVFARIDHRQGAMSRDMALLPSEVIVFGDPKSDTPLMQCAQTAGIDLPMKALVWQDSDGQTWLGYNDPAWIAERHGASDCPAVAPLKQAMQELVEATLAP